MHLLRLLTKRPMRMCLFVAFGLWFSTKEIITLAENIPAVPNIPTESNTPASKPSTIKNDDNYVSSREYFKPAKGKFNENLYWSKFPIPKISKNFTPKQRKTIWLALIKAQKVMQSKKVMSCIKRHTIDKQYSDETLHEAAQRFVVNAQRSLVDDLASYPSKKRRQYLYINNDLDLYMNPNDYEAWAEVGRSRTVEKDITINLRSDRLSLFDTNAWAGLIVHEILHVYSYDHNNFDKDKDFYEQFKGNFVYETHWCVSSEGNEKEYANRSGSNKVVVNPLSYPSSVPISSPASSPVSLPPSISPLVLPTGIPTPLRTVESAPEYDPRLQPARPNILPSNP
jgi:hypothetical protein